MKTVVVGGGIVGVTTAYFLAQEGHEVVVLDKCSELGTDATGGNAGLISPGHSFAWASATAPRMLISALLGREAAIRVKPRLDRHLVSWGLQFLRECTDKRSLANTTVKFRLAQYGQNELNKIADEENLSFHHIKTGALYAYRTEETLAEGAKKMQLMEEYGLPVKILDRNEVVALDPGFANASELFAGGVYIPSDASGSSQVFTVELAKRCAELGAEFHTGVAAERFVVEGDRVVGVQTDSGVFRGDNYVLAAGVMSPFLSRTVGQRLSIYPVKGYSLTADILDPDGVPQIGGVDEATLVAWTRMGDEMRVSSTAEFAGWGRDWKYSDFKDILTTCQQLFGSAVDWDRARMRACLRPMTPDGPPIIGRGKHQNLWYNTGHGNLGVSMGPGASRILTDLMAGRNPQTSLEGTHVRSFRR